MRELAGIPTKTVGQLESFGERVCGGRAWREVTEAEGSALPAFIVLVCCCNQFSQPLCEGRLNSGPAGQGSGAFTCIFET